MKFKRLDSTEPNIVYQEVIRKLNNSRLSTQSKTPPQEKEDAKLSVTQTQFKHSKDATEQITERIHQICHDIFLSETALLDAEPLDMELFFLGKYQNKTKINLLKSLELVVYKTLYGHSWATIERANSVKFEGCKSYPYTTDDIEIKITTLQQYHRDWKKLGYLEKLHNAVKSHPEFLELKELKKQHVEDFDKQLSLLNNISTLPNDEKVKLWLLKNDNQDFKILDIEHNTNNSDKKDIDTIENLSLTSSETFDIYDDNNLDEENSLISLEMNKKWDENLTINCNLLDIQSVIIKKEKTFEQQKQNIIKLTKDGAYLKECSALNGDMHSSINFMNNYLQLLKDLYNEGCDTLAFRYWSKSCRSDLKFDHTEILEDGNMSKQEIKEQNKYLDALARLIDLKLSNNKITDIPCVATTIIGNDLIIGLNTNSSIQSVKDIVGNIIKLSAEPTKLNAYFNIPTKIDNITKLKDFLQNKDDKSLASGNSDTNKSITTFYDNFFGEKKAKFTESEFLKQLNSFNKNSLLSLINKLVEGVQLKSEVTIESKNFPKLKKAFLESQKLLNYQKQYSDIDQLIQNGKGKLEKINIIYTINGKKVDVDLYTNDNSKQIMHAEISIIEYIKSNPELIEKLLKLEGKIPYIYIGNNKKACPACHVSIGFFNEDQTNPFTVVYRGHHHDFDGLIQLDSSNYNNKIIEIPNQEIFKQKLDQLNQYQYASFVVNGKENTSLLEKMYKIFTETHNEKNIKDEHNPTPTHSVADGELRDEIEPNAFNRKYDDNYSYNKEDIAAISNKLFTQEKLVELQDKNIQWKGIINKDGLEVIKDGETIVGISKVNEHYIVLAIHRSEENYTVLCRDAVSNEWENYKNSDNFEITINDKKTPISKENLTFSLAKNNNDVKNSAIYALNDAVKMVEYVSDNQGNFNQESFDKIKFTGKTNADEKETTEYLQSIFDSFFNFEKMINQDSSETLADLDPIYQEFKQKNIVNLMGTLKNKFSKISHETLLHSKIHNEINTIRKNFADLYFKYSVDQIEKENIIDVEQLRITLETKKQELEDQSHLEEPIEIILTENILAGVEKVIRYCQSEKGKSTVKANIKALQSAFQLAKDEENEIISKNENVKDLVEKTLKVLEKVKDTTLCLKTREEITKQVEEKLGNPEAFSQKNFPFDKSDCGRYDDQELLEQAKPVQGFYSNDDVNILIEALLKEKGISLDGNTREVTSENETQTVKTYILEARSLNTNNIASIKKEDYLHDLARDVGKILLNEGIKQILIPIRLENEQHWVTARLNVSQENKISAFIYDSAYRGKCLHNDIIYELSELFNKKDQLNIIFKDQLNATTFHEEQSKKLVGIVEKFEIQEANVEKIQNPTGTKLINVYCGGYSAHLTANLAISQNPAWGYLDSIDSNQRLDDAILVNQYLPLQAKSFAKEGDNFESKKISQQKDHQRLELANKYFDSKKENLNKVLEENEPNFDELFKFLDSYDKGTIFKPGTVINHQQLLSHLRNLPQEVESNFNFLKLDQTDRVFNDALTPEQIVYVLLCLKDQLQIKGNNPMQTGLNISDIKINLNTIIKANQDNTDFYISPKIMEQEELLSSLSDWQNIPHSHYSALIKLENEGGDKHAVLFYASKEADHLAITITDPLSQEASTFKLGIANLVNSLHEEGRTIQVIYSGRQDKDYGTCADMSLIMLQELIEQTAKPMLDNHNQTTVDNFINNNHITYENSMIHNFDYNNLQHVEIAGDISSFH